MIEANHWNKDANRYDIEFDLSSLMDEKKVLTIIITFEEPNGNQFPVTSYSVLVSRILTDAIGTGVRNMKIGTVNMIVGSFIYVSVL